MLCIESFAVLVLFIVIVLKIISIVFVVTYGIRILIFWPISDIVKISYIC